MTPTLFFLDDSTIITAFCFLRQGERSIDHGLAGKWIDLKDYYYGIRLEKLKQLSDHLVLSFEKDLIAHRDALNITLLESGKRTSIFAMMIEKIRWGRKRKGFIHSEIDFIFNAFRSLIMAIEQTEEPSREDLIELRQKLFLSESIVRTHIVDKQKLKQANMIENYNMPSHLHHFSLEEIVH